MIAELERVALTADIPEYGLKAGDLGMVVHVYGAEVGYEVEFVTLSGELVALVALHPTQIRSTEEDEIAHVRRVQTA
jgi:hypothetical protein